MTQPSTEPSPAIRCPYCRNQFKVENNDWQQAITNTNIHISRAHSTRKLIPRSSDPQVKFRYK